MAPAVDPELTVTGYFTVLLVGPRPIPIVPFSKEKRKETGFDLLQRRIIML